MIRPRRKPFSLRPFYCHKVLTSVLFLFIICHARSANTSKTLILSVSSNNDITHPPVSVLPPCPADEPLYCPASSQPYTPCGNERYCAPHNSSNTTAPPLCLHKKLSPPSSSDALVIGLVLLCCFVAAMAGIGGGGLLLPVMILGMNFLPKEAAVMSNAGVFGNTLGQLLVNSLPGGGVNAHEPHEVAGTVLMIMPSLLAGGSIAVTFVGLVPSTVILILALVTLALACVKTFLKAGEMRKMELGEVKEEGVEEYDKKSDSYETPSDNLERSSIAVFEPIFSSPPPGLCSKANSFISRYSIEVVTLTCWFLNASIFILIKEDNAFGIDKCSPGYFILVFIPALNAVIFTWLGRREIKRHAHSPDLSFSESNDSFGSSWAVNTSVTHTLTLNSNDMRTSLLFNPETQHPFAINPPPSQHPSSSSKTFDNLVWWLPPLSLLIGILCALVGVGGGELLGPTLLLLHMDPQVSSATTATLSLLNSGTNALHHCVAGMIISYAYTGVIGAAAFIGGGAGRMTALWIAGNGRRSVIAYSLGIVLLLAGVLVFYELVSVEADWRNKAVC